MILGISPVRILVSLSNLFCFYGSLFGGCCIRLQKVMCKGPFCLEIMIVILIAQLNRNSYILHSALLESTKCTTFNINTSSVDSFLNPGGLAVV